MNEMKTYKNGAVIQRWYNKFEEIMEILPGIENARLVWRLDALEDGSFLISIFPDTEIVEI